MDKARVIIRFNVDVSFYSLLMTDILLSCKENISTLTANLSEENEPKLDQKGEGSDLEPNYARIF